MEGETCCGFVCNIVYVCRCLNLCFCMMFVRPYESIHAHIKVMFGIPLTPQRVLDARRGSAPAHRPSVPPSTTRAPASAPHASRARTREAALPPAPPPPAQRGFVGSAHKVRVVLPPISRLLHTPVRMNVTFSVFLCMLCVCVGV